MRISFLAGALAACSALAALAAEQKVKPSPAPVGVVASLGDKAITDAQLEELAKERLVRIRNDEYNIKRQVLEEYINRTLLEKEAGARGISVEELEKREVHDKVTPITEEQKRAVYESNSRQFQGKGETDALAQIETDLKRLRLNQARSKLIAALRERTGVKVLLQPPRSVVAEGENPATGPKDASVTIVEFSDFQCPACGRAFPTIKRLLQQYRGKVRLVFRDFPLPMHPQAPKAAEAAACANDQGRFWEMHDQLFSSQQALQIADLKRHASELGLDADRFDACLDSGKHAAGWKANMDAGRRLGVNATPTFFINGRMLSGAQPYQSFVDVIEQELARGTAGASQ